MLTRILDWAVGREPVATATGIAAVITAALGVGAAFGLAITASQIAALGALAAALAGWLGRSKVRPVETVAERQLGRLGLDVESAASDDQLRGSIPLALILLLVGLALALAFIFTSCDALFEDEDEPNDLGYQTQLISLQTPLQAVLSASAGPAGIPGPSDHDGGGYDDGDCDPSWDECGGGRDDYDQWNNDQRNHNRRNRGAFSPGPFDRSPVDFHDNCISLDCGGRGQDERRQREDRGPSRSAARPVSLFPPSPDAIRAFVVQTIKAGIDMGRLFAETTISFVENLLIGIA